VGPIEAASTVALVACSQGSVMMMVNVFVGFVTVRLPVGVLAFMTTVCVPASVTNVVLRVNFGVVASETNVRLELASVEPVTVNA